MKKKLSEVCKFQYGYPFDSSLFSDKTGTPVIRIRDIVRGFSETKTTETCSTDYIVDNNDILIGMDGEFNIAKWKGGKAFLNQRVCKLIPFDVNKDYIFYHLPKILKSIEEKTSFATVKHLSAKQLNSIYIDIPEQTIQYKIANVFIKIDSLINKRKQQLSKLDQLVKSRFIEMFGDPVKNPYNWNTTSLNALGELNRGVSKHRPRNAPELLNGKYPLIQTGDIASSDLYITKYSSTYSEFGLKQSRMWPVGTLCITIAANIAKTSILKFDACFPDSVVGFISGKDYIQVFIHFWFSFFQKILEEQAPESAQKNINLKILNELKVISPPNYIQKSFFNFVQHIEKSKSSVKQSLNTLETLKKSLMHEYFG